jgi:hypothetical protein
VKRYGQGQAARIACRAAAVVPATAGGFVVSQIAAQGTASAAAEGCSPPTTLQIQAYQSCIQTGPNSGGTYIDYLQGWGEVLYNPGAPSDCGGSIYCPGGGPSGFYHIELVGPQTNKLANGPTVNVAPGTPAGDVSVPGPTWQKNMNATPGNYCSILWYQTGANSYSNVQEACIYNG